MKNIYKVICIFIVFIILLLQFSPKLKSDFYGEGNSMDNIREYANIAESEKYIAFCRNIDQPGLCYINKSTLEYKKINNIDSYRIYHINIVDESIYYNVGGDIHKYNIETEKDTVISKKDTFNTIIVDNYIYTVKPDDNGNSKLYKMDLNGKSKKVIIRNLENFYIYKDIIYFTSNKDKYSLYCSDLNGSNVKKISDMSVAQISIHNDKIFAIDVNDRMLYSMDLNGNNRHRLGDYKIQHINITDDKIVFNSVDKLYLANMDLTKVDVLSEGVFCDINVVGDVILYRKPVASEFGNEVVYIMNINNKAELKFSLDNLYSILMANS